MFCFFFCNCFQHRTLGDPTEEEVTKNAAAVDSGGGKPVPGLQKLVSDSGEADGGGARNDVDANSNKPKTISAIVARPDGLLKNTKEEVEVSREETKECTVTAERKHFGDFTDDVSTFLLTFNLPSNCMPINYQPKGSRFVDPH